MKAVLGFVLVLCHLGATQAWNCQEAPRLYNARQIEASQGKVLARGSSNRVYFLSGKSWYRLGSVSLKHVSIGSAGIWGVDSANRVYKFVAGEFLPSTGTLLHQVDAGGNGQVVGLTPTTNTTYCLISTSAASYKGVGSLSWRSLGRAMKHYSCGPYGCWGVDSNNRVYVSQVSPTACSSSAWSLVSGRPMHMIDVSTDGRVFGVTTTGLVYQRTHVSSSRPQGLTWSSVPMCMPVTSLTYDLGQLWILTKSGLLLQCTH
ncbi:fish-egg lectin-like [Dunckerocampus dactyliophorus]|uniref:fish-egg lectin-like n=1 Tax=Dunckerocampus dactyliophorus TaxID=161453 RepID=UPI00240692EB|nr:fish-egg lectin-like [Dunckerocampus dactyliophorus]